MGIFRWDSQLKAWDTGESLLVTEAWLKAQGLEKATVAEIKAAAIQAATEALGGTWTRLPESARAASLLRQ